MASEKKYYWLKLEEGFFQDKPIKKLRKIAGGDTYTIIYLKMLLRSLATNGYLYFDGVESDFVAELALDLDEDEENVKVTVQFLQSVGYLKVGNRDDYFLTECDSMTGSESQSAARVRKHRERQKALQCNTDVTNCNTDKENKSKENKSKENKSKENKSKENESKEKVVTDVTKKKNSTVYYPNDEELNQAFLHFMEMRKKIKKPMTDRAVTLAMNKLRELASSSDGVMDNDKAIKILDQSTMSCWQGLFPLKEEKGNSNSYIDKIKNRVSEVDNW